MARTQPAAAGQRRSSRLRGLPAETPVSVPVIRSRRASTATRRAASANTGRPSQIQNTRSASWAAQSTMPAQEEAVHLTQAAATEGSNDGATALPAASQAGVRVVGGTTRVRARARARAVNEMMEVAVAEEDEAKVEEDEAKVEEDEAKVEEDEAKVEEDEAKVEEDEAKVEEDEATVEEDSEEDEAKVEEKSEEAEADELEVPPGFHVFRSARMEPILEGSGSSSSEVSGDTDDVPAAAPLVLEVEALVESPAVVVASLTIAPQEHLVFEMPTLLYNYGETPLHVETGNLFWIDHCNGDIRFYRDSTTGTVRITMHENGTGRVLCNHYLLRYPALTMMQGNNLSLCWSARAVAPSLVPAAYNCKFSCVFQDALAANAFYGVYEYLRSTLPP